MSAERVSDHAVWGRVVAGRPVALCGAPLGDPPEGLDVLVLLAASVKLNVDKGTPLGLAYDRQSLEALLAGASAGDVLALSGAAEQLRGWIAASEVELGRVDVAPRRA